MENESYVTDKMKIFKHQPAKNDPNKSIDISKQIIYDYTLKFLDEIKSLTLTLPLVEPFKPLERLKEIQRTGKAIRLENMKLKSIKARSIYDHVISMAYLADCFLVLDKNKLIKECDYPNLGRIIAYHEISESLIGDIPAYTDIDGHTTKNKNDIRIKNLHHDQRERIVNNFLWMYANSRQRSSIEEMNRNLSKQNTPFMKYFRMLDRIDPIIAIWRYLYRYREELKTQSAKFIYGMNDFFVYPKTTAYKTNKYTVEFPYLKDILEVLMNPEAAIKYCKGTKIETLITSKTKAKIIKYLVEEVPLFVDN